MAAYTFEELKAALYTAADPNYLAPFFLGDYGNGRELFEALLAVLVRTDQAIVRTTQALFISPWSGQADQPAMGRSRAELGVELARTKYGQIPITFGAGAVLFEELAPEWNATGGEIIATGRRYTLTRDVTFLPGETPPIAATVIAERIGYGYANPYPGTLSGIVQVGAGFQNVRASIVQSPSTATLVTTDVPDTAVPEHVGQYVELTAGANQGKVRRIVGYVAAGPGNGGSLILAGTFVGRSILSAPAGTFEVGEQVTQTDSAGPTIIATGVVLAVGTASPWYIVIETTSGQFQPTAGTVGPVVGVMSAANFTIEDVTDTGKLVDETATCSWRILDWADDIGASITNPEGASVVPGSYPMLDALGGERGIARAPGEDDESYRKRVATVADIVSPAAIRRIGNRIWAPYTGTVCLREVGQRLFPGLFADVASPDAAVLFSYPYDLDGLSMRGVKTGEFLAGERVVQDDGGILAYGRVTITLDSVPAGDPVPLPDPLVLEVAAVRGKFKPGIAVVGETSGASFMPGAITGGLRPVDRFKTLLDYTEFRAFFLLGVPPPVLGEFGIPYDAPHPYNAFDAAPYLTFSDGMPITSAVLNRATWQAVDQARAGGVGFTLYPEDLGCF